VGGSLLKYATAQPLLKIEAQGASYLFFFATPGIAPEFAFADATLRSIDGGAVTISHAKGLTYVGGVQPGTEVAFAVTCSSGAVTRVVVLTQAQAENCWTTTSAGQQRVILTPADVYFDQGQLHLLSRTVKDLHFSVFPRPQRDLLASAQLQRAGTDGLFENYTVQAAEKTVAVKWERVRRASAVPPVNVKRVAEAPAEAEFKDAGEWLISLPKDSLIGVNDVFLRIVYAGDIARMYSGKELITDDFYKGTTWEIGLDRLSPEQWAEGLRLEILPLRKDAPIYLPQSAWPQFASDGQISEVKSITAEPEYEISVQLGSDKSPDIGK